MYRLSVREILENYRDGRMTCQEYVTRCLERAEDLKAFNYFISMDRDRMLQDAKEADARYRNKTNRPLEGIPIAFKDNIDIGGEATGAGTPGLAGLKPKKTAEVAKRLFDAGAIHAGRTNMHEMACGITSTNQYTGPCHNFFNFDFSCGGSSGGSGGAVAADIIPVALGTDTGGSIRVPASFNGVFGYRPSIGRWPSDYGVKFTNLRDSVGPLARSAGDIAILDSVVTGEKCHPELSPAEIVIGVPTFCFWDGLDIEVKTYATQFLTELRNKGFKVIEEGMIPSVKGFQQRYKFLTSTYEAIPRLTDWLQLNNHEMSPESVVNKLFCARVRAIFQDALKNPPSEEDYSKALIAREELITDLQSYFREYQLDCILMPATKIPPQRLNILDSDPYPGSQSGPQETLVFIVTANSEIANICDNPSLVIPGGLARKGGTPFGMQIDGLRGTDQRLLSVAKAIEKALDL